MAKNEELLDKGRAVQDMIKMEGWQVIKERVEREIKDEYNLIREFPIKDRALQEIAAEYLEHRANLNAYERVLGFVEEFLKAIK